MSHGYAMLPNYRGRPVCRCGECRKCKNREAVYRYRESRDEFLGPSAQEDYRRIDAVMEAERDSQ
jgi:hypothetical protein